MAQPARRGSGAGGLSIAGMGDEGPSAASSPVPQQQPPQSLGLAGPPPPLGPKKKSGFQITSVTPAQASASLSANNSIAEDTESYDDLDESHTEDLSSSELLDASLSRATDLGAPGRSSSEETLSNLQEAETPGALSPNQPRLPGLPPPLLNGIPGPQELLQHHMLHHPAPQAANVNMMNNQNPAAAHHHHPISQAAQAVAAVALGSAVGQQQQPLPPHQVPAPLAATATSRFRVVKLDSSSEPFRKGRWTCTEYYEREPPASEAPHRAVESVRQAEVGSERESTSESSVSSTLSHYTESAGSGEGVQAASDQAPQTHSQDPGYGGQHKAAFQPPAPVGSMHQHPFSPQVQPVQTVPQIHYATQQQHLPTHLPPGQGMPVAPTQTMTGSMTDYIHPPIMQASIPLVHSGHNPQQHMQSTAAPAQSSVASALPTTGHATTLMPTAVASTQSVGVVPPMNLSSAVQQPPTSNQGMSSILQHSAAAQPTQLVQGPQSGVIQQGIQMITPGASPQVLIPQNTPLLVKPQPQGLDPMLQGMPNQQMPAISPIPPSPSVSSMATSAGLVSAPAMSQPSTVHNGAQGVTRLTPSLPGTHHMPHQIPLNSAQFFPPSLIQTFADARRLMEHSVSGLPQGIMAESISGMGVSSGLDASGSIVGTGQLLPMKTLPLSTPLVDGDDESSSGASVVAIDNKIEQAMDLVKSHLMYAVREEVEVLKEQIKELIEKNSQLEQENSLLKTLASPEQMAQFQAQLQTGSSPASTQPPAPPASGPPGTA